MQLLVGKRPCRSIFRLNRQNEDALTHALGYLLAQDTTLLAAFLKSAGVLPRIRGKRYATEVEGTQLILQERRNSERTDLVIQWTDVRVVVEAKIGRGQPIACQLLRYTTGCDCPAHNGRPDRSPWIGYGRRFIVTLTTDALDGRTQRAVLERLSSETVDDYSGINLRSLTWADVYHLIKHRAADPRCSTSLKWALNQFITFFREDYEMHYYDAEVLIQDVVGKQYDQFQIRHMYQRDCKGPSDPLYFAPYHANGGGGVSHVAKCLRVINERVDDGLIGRMHSALSTTPGFDQQWEQHWLPGLEFVIQNDSKGSPTMRFFFLDDPQPLGKQVRKKAGFKMLPVGYKKTFQALLRDETL